MIIKPRCKGFISVNAHPHGCYKNVEDMVNRALLTKQNSGKRPKNVVVIGTSSGYGLSSRIVSAFSYNAKTIGVSLEKESVGKRTATAGFYNNCAFDALATKHNIAYKTINGDAFSKETKDEVVASCLKLFGEEKIDLLVYSLAAPKRINPLTKNTYTSVIKPIGNVYQNKTVNIHTGVVSDINVDPASEQEIADTIKVMGGEDWQMWIDQLASKDLLSKEFITVAYSYVGPSTTHAIYKDGTIGKAKDDLLNSCKIINDKLKLTAGKAYVSINKALVTQASSAIPVVPLYICLLYKVMKKKGIHEDCLEQVQRLFFENMYAGKDDFADDTYRIFMDDLEMREDVQEEVDKIWSTIESGNIGELTDIEGYREEFFSLFGFGRKDVNYDEDVSDF